MKHPSRSTSVLTTIALLCAAAAVQTHAVVLTPQDGAAEKNKEDGNVVPTLSVTGTSELKKKADQVHITLGVVSEAESASSATDDNSETMQEVIAALKDAGLTDEEYETGRFGINPVWSQPGREGGTRRITGYRVTNTIEITSQNLEKIGEWIAAATEAGANSVDSVSFDLADPRTHQAEAIRVAAEHALNDAQVLAGAAGVRLKRAITIALDGASQPPIPVRYDAMVGARLMAAEVATPPIAPGDITVSASVTIVYEIEQRK